MQLVFISLVFVFYLGLSYVGKVALLSSAFSCGNLVSMLWYHRYLFNESFYLADNKKNIVVVS